MNADQVQPVTSDGEPRRETPRSCWHRCLPGEYLAMALIIHSGCGAAAWAAGAWQVPRGLILVAAGVWIVGRSAGAFSGRWFAPLATAALALAAFALWQSHAALPHAALVVFSPWVFLTMLGVILAADLVELVPSLPFGIVASRLRRLNWYRLAVWAFGLAFVSYMVALPTGSWIVDRLQPPEMVRVLEDLSLAEQVRVRSMEAMTALWFFALGATIGSFLNVVAYRLPRGESIVFRRSRCPQCETPIKGRDNVPILGWLLLGGRCRACGQPISLRYPIVESIAAALFLWLYFVELISGGANIPVRHPNAYHGVVWIIFYTKWDLIRLYSYHCFAMSTLLACALIDIDRGRVPARGRWLVGAVLFVPPLIWPELLPVPCFANAAGWLPAPWLRAAASCLVGGLLGAGLGWLTARGIAPSAAATEDSETRGRIAGCLAVVGMSLGWQAAIAVLLSALLFLLAAASIARWRRWPPPRMTPVLLAAFVVHHAVWRWTVEHGPAWWPSHKTSAGAWIAVAMGYVALLLVNRLVIRQWRDAGPIPEQPKGLCVPADATPIPQTMPSGFVPEQQGVPYD